MKKTMRIPAVIILAFVLLLISVFPAAANSNSIRSTHKPLKAEDVELIKKVTLKGAGAKTPSKTAPAATGIVGSVATGTRYAILIGISNYPGTGSDLEYSDDDAIAMKEILKSTYGFREENITMLIDGAATRTAIYNAVLGLKLNPEDELVFFYSGHGAKGKVADDDRSNTDQSIVVCNDTYTNFDFIWDGELKALFSGFQDNRIIFVFDSCLSGGMSVLKGTNRVVNMACSANGLSYEGSWGGGHGQFTYYFAMEGMGQSLADSAADQDTVVTVEEAFDYAKPRCLWQTPTIADSFDKDLLP